MLRDMKLIEKEVADAELDQFIRVNGYENRDREQLRDILIISRIYDRNFERLLSAQNTSKKNIYKFIEKRLEEVSTKLRELALISVKVSTNPSRTKKGA